MSSQRTIPFQNKEKENTLLPYVRTFVRGELYIALHKITKYRKRSAYVYVRKGGVRIVGVNGKTAMEKGEQRVTGKEKFGKSGLTSSNKRNWMTRGKR